MKKIFLISAIILTTSGGIYSQEIGVRFGNISGGNAAIDAVFGTSKYSRIHADVSFGSGVGIDLLWDFLDRPLGSKSLNLYLGAGPYTQIADPFWLGVAGEAGIEYHFKKAPIALGIDWRPSFSLVKITEFHPNVLGINVRFVFGKRR